MITAAEFNDNVKQFYGTTMWYEVYPQLLLTDGTKWVADEAEAYWLVADIPWSIAKMIRKKDWGTVILTVNEDKSATVTVDDGNGHEYYRQKIEYTDFPVNSFKFWAIYDGTNIVCLLPSEY